MRMIQSVAFLVIALALGELAMAQAERHTLDIKPQPIKMALRDLGEQTGIQILFRSEDVARGEVTTPAIVGEMSPQEALERMLAKAPELTYEWMNAHTVLISARGRVGASGAPDARGSDVKLAEGAAAAQQATDAPGQGTENENGAPKLQEVVVTAQKRKERLQDVPISISVLSGRELDRSNYVSVNDVLNVSAPGVATSYSSFPGTTRLSVRGVSSSEMIGGGTSPIAYYVDSVPFGFVRSAMVPDVGSFDLQQVEALRGPQGTLYGANAVNGVVRILTNDADLNRVEFKARTSVSSTESGGTGYRGDVAVNVPIVDDKLAARLTGSYANAPGWIDNLVKRNYNDIKLSDVRLKVNARPVDNLSLGLSWWHSKADIGAFNLADTTDVYPGIKTDPTTNRFDAMGLKIGYQFPGVSVSSATSYIDYNNRSNFDITPYGAAFDAPDWVGQLQFNNFTSRVFAQEIALTSEASGSWRWTAGAFYRDASDHYFSTAIYLPTYPAPEDYGDISRSLAAFGELTRKFLDGKFELTGGLRYFRDNVTVTNVEPALHVTDTFHHVSPRVVMNWRPSSEMTAYVSYSEGFRGGFSQDGFTKQLAPNLPGAKPDNLHNYEIGLKGTLLAGRISYDSAAYYMDWQDVQQHLIVPAGEHGAGSADAIVNGGSASGPGIDLNVMTRPLADLSGFEVGINASWNDLTFDEDVLTDGALLFPKGGRLNYSPEYTFGALAGYSFPLGGSGLRSRVSISGSYHTKQLARDTSGMYPGDDLLNVHAGFSLGVPERWTAELFIDNATNDRGNIITSFVPFADMRTRPRTVGLQVDYKFNQ